MSRLVLYQWTQAKNVTGMIITRPGGTDLRRKRQPGRVLLNSDRPEELKRTAAYSLFGVEQRLIRCECAATTPPTTPPRRPSSQLTIPTKCKSAQSMDR
jgi:hypothetical protein